ncbi:MAG: isoprenylcysteine carboxylmethyltransferase family protein [Anaerolineae bacterium]|nr:isoprenylcysteine carboxylmethyltransferase family protein [Anaerolineae bacterium]
MIHKWIYGAGLAAVTTVRTYYAVNMPQPRQSDGDPTEKTLLFLQLLGMQILPLTYLFSNKLSFADYRMPRLLKAITTVLGAISFGGAAYLLHRSHADLGSNWRAELQEQPDQTLVTDGIYRVMRHPMYAAHWLWAIAQALLLPNWIAGPSFLVTFWPLYRHRVPREEAQMIATFGDDYRAYAEKVGRLI